MELTTIPNNRSICSGDPAGCQRQSINLRHLHSTDQNGDERHRLCRSQLQFSQHVIL